jgi:hypothetical protein
MFEEQELDEPLFQPKDEVEYVSPNKKYPLAQAVVGLATDTPFKDEEVNYATMIDDAFRPVAADRNYSDTLSAEEFAKNGNAAAFEASINSIRARNALAGKSSKDFSDALYSKGREIARQAVENVATSNEQVVANNKDIVNKVDKVSNTVSTQQVLEKAKIDGWMIARGMGYYLTPLSAAEGWNLTGVVEKFVPKGHTSIFQGRSKDRDALQTAFASIPNEQKGQWLEQLRLALKDETFISDLTAASMLIDVATNDSGTWDGVFDVLQKVGDIAAVTVLFGAIGTSARLFGAAAKLKNAELLIAQAGGKASIEAADAAKMLQQRALVGTAMEASGLQSVVDAGKLVSLGISKILPESITTAATGLQRIIIADTSKLIEDLKTTIAGKGITDAEMAVDLAALERTYSKANDPTIHNVSFAKVDGDSSHLATVVYKPADASSFRNAEAATAWAESQGLKGFRVIPDTTNTGYLVSAEHKSALMLKKTELEALIAEKAVEKAARDAKGAKKAPTSPVEAAKPTSSMEGSPKPPERLVEPLKPSTPVPKSLTTSKPKYSIGPDSWGIKWASPIDKAIYQLTNAKGSKSDAEVAAWLKEATGWDDATIKEQGVKIRTALKKLASNADNFDKDTLDLPSVVSTAKADTDNIASVELPISNGELRELFDEMHDDTTGGYATGLLNVDGVIISSSIPSEAVSMVKTLGARLGLQDEKLIILQRADVKEYADLLGAGVWKEMDSIVEAAKNANAFYLDVGEGRSIIVMRGVSPSNKQKWLGTFAHEYGHLFQARYASLNPVIAASFRKWLRTNKVAFKEVIGTDSYGNAITLQELTENLNPHAFVQYFRADRAEKYAMMLANGNLEVLDKARFGLHNWTSSYAEWFAENFARWAFTDEVPTTILGQHFQSIVNGIKLIAARVGELLGIPPLRADKNIADILNQHVKQNNLIAESMRAAGPIQMDKVPARSLRSLQDSLASTIEELRAIEAAETGLTHGWLVEHSVKRTPGYNAIKGFDKEDINSMARFALGDWALGTSSQVYAQRVVGVMQESRYQKLLTEYVRPSIEALSGKEKVLLDNILVLGDKEGRVLDDLEILGIDPAANVKVVNAYKHVRALRDVLWTMRNDTAVQVLTKQGNRSIITSKITLEVPTEQLIGKLMDKNDRTLAGKTGYDVSTGKQTLISNSDLEVVKLAEPVTIDGKKRSVLLMKPEDYSTTSIDKVIPYRPGEYKRIYSDEYFVKLRFNEDVDGTPTQSFKTHRTAASKKEAEKYAASLTEAISLHAKGALTLDKAASLMQPFGWKPEDLMADLARGKFEGAEVKVLYNRTDDDYTQEFAANYNNWSSERGEKITSIYGEDTVNTLNPLDAIASEISNTAYITAVADWRASTIVRWHKEFFNELPIDVQAMSAEDAFFYMHNNKGRYVGGDQRLKFAERVQDYVMQELRVPSAQERAWIGGARHLSEVVEGVGDNKAMHFLGKTLRSTNDMPSWLRTISFHSFFGFNPVQLLVQGANAVNALLISPKYGAMASKTAPLYRIALMSDNPEIWTKYAKLNKITSLGLGMQEDEFVQTVQAIRRSGLLDGINSTSLYGAETGAYGLFNRKLRNTGAASSFFFNRGEEMSRLISFDIARREFKAANPTKSWFDDAALAAIIERQDDLTQNMTRANTAWWQKGAISVPTQFMQYQVKIMMNVVQSLLGNSRAFTRAEASRLLIGHMLMFGTAGFFLERFIREAVGEFTKDWDQETQLYVQQGVVAGVINSISQYTTDEKLELAIGTRFNTFNFFEDFVNGLMSVIKGEPEAPTIIDVLGGASGGAILRAGGAASKALSLWSHAPLDYDTMKEGLILIGAGSSSAINNVRKAQIASMNYNTVVDKARNPLYAINDKEKFLMGFGIPPAAAEDLDILFKTTRSHKKEVQDLAKLLSEWRFASLEALRDGDTGRYNSLSAGVMSLLNGLDPKMRADVEALAWQDRSMTAQKKLMTEIMMKELTPASNLVERNVGDTR